MNNINFKRKIKWSVLLSSIIILNLSCNSTTQKPTKESETTTATEALGDTKTLTRKQFENMGLQLANLTKGQRADKITVNGMVDVPPENVAKVSFPISGFIKLITHNVLPGKFVAKGSVLATLQSMEAMQLQQDYIERYAQNDFLLKELERQKTLVAEDAAAKRKLQEAENNLKVNKALLTSYEAKLNLIGVGVQKLQKGEITSNLPIIAPISGYIKTANVAIGSNFSPTDVLFEIMSKQHLHVELKVFEKDAYKVKERQTVVFNDPRIGGRVEGKVFLVGKNFENDTKAVNVHVHLSSEKAEQQLIPGQYLSAQILTENRSANLLPESAILKEGNKSFVYVLTSKTEKEVTFKRVTVEVGSTQNGEVEIISPAALENVVINHVTFLHGGEAEE